MTPNPAIRVRGLRHRYGDHDVLRGVDLDVARGEAVALLGPNGAGKTTTLDVLQGHLRRTAGEVSVLGLDPCNAGRRLRDRVGIALQSAGFPVNTTVAEAARRFARFYSKAQPIDLVLERVGIAHLGDRRIARLSGGEARRLDLALAIIGDPDVLFLDEPTTGLDVQSRRVVWGVVRDLRAAGAAVLLTTHYSDEAAAICDRVALLAGGRITLERSAATGAEIDRLLLGEAVAA